MYELQTPAAERLPLVFDRLQPITIREIRPAHLTPPPQVGEFEPCLKILVVRYCCGALATACIQRQSASPCWSRCPAFSASSPVKTRSCGAITSTPAKENTPTNQKSEPCTDSATIPHDAVSRPTAPVHTSLTRPSVRTDEYRLPGKPRHNRTVRPLRPIPVVSILN